MPRPSPFLTHMPKRTRAVFRKPRQKAIAPDKDPWSAKARLIGKQISKGAHAEALTALDREAGGKNLPSTRKAQIISFVADVAFVQGRYAEAANTYAKASASVQNDLQGWLRPAVGRVRALLASAESDAARSVANDSIQKAVASRAQYQRIIAQAQSTTSANISVDIPAKPPGPSQVATRMAQHFFDAGEQEIAGSLWRQALDLDPKRAISARLGLSKIALRASMFDEAANLAAGALDAGKYSRKTLGAWPLLIRAKSSQGTTTLDPTLLQNLAGTKPSVRARTMLVIARTLRTRGNPQWETVVHSWLDEESAKKYPIIEAEMRKLVSADARRSPDATPAARIEAAVALANVPNVSRPELLAAFNEQVRANCSVGNIPDWQGFVDHACITFGENVRPKFMHSIANAFIQGGHQDVARPILQAIVATQVPSERVWRQSMWKLGKLEAASGKHLIAASHYQLLGSQPEVPARFRLQAKLEWVNSLVKSGKSDSLLAAIPEMAPIMNDVMDHVTLLDFARQLKFAPDTASELRKQAFERGESLALQAMNVAQSPDRKVEILHKLTRRRVDFGKFPAVVSSWKDLDATSKDQLWSGKPEYWEYLALVYFSYAQTDQNAEAETLARQYLDDPTSPNASVALEIEYARHQVHIGELKTAFASFTKAVQKSPNYLRSAYAYYWFALENLSRNDEATAAVWGGKMQQVVGDTNLSGEQKLLMSAAIYLQNSGRYTAPIYSNHDLGEADFDRVKSIINNDVLVFS